MNGWTPKDRILGGLTTQSGIVTNEPISKVINTTASGSKHIRIDIKVSSVTQVGTLTVKLQGAITGAETFVDLAGANATSTFTADGIITLTQNVEIAADQPNMPLLPALQVVLTTTNAGDVVTVDNVWITQED